MELAEAHGKQVGEEAKAFLRGCFAEVERLNRTLEDIATGFGGLNPENYETTIRKYAASQQTQ